MAQRLSAGGVAAASIRRTAARRADARPAASQRARRRARDGSWTAAAVELVADGYSVAELAELMAIAENDLALGHKITCLPSFNVHLDALQSRRRSAAEPLRGPVDDAGDQEAVVALVSQTLRQAPPRAGRVAHTRIAHELEPSLAARYTDLLDGLAWALLAQRDHLTLRHAILDAWRARTHRRAA